jgi:hypothetical protein
MWKYAQGTAELFRADGQRFSIGYAGKGAAKNDPDQQCTPEIGPLPKGYYAIRAAEAHPRLGPVALPLNPDSSNQMCGRSGFYILEVSLRIVDVCIDRLLEHCFG